MEISAHFTALLAGFFGGVHCVGMCGGVVGALTMGLAPERRASLATLLPIQLGYNLGRLMGYMVAGALMGAMGSVLLQWMPLYEAKRVLYTTAGVMMVLMGLYLGGWWLGLARVEGLGAALWRRIEPLGRSLLPVRGIRQAIAIGFVWAWIPCGLVTSVLIMAVASGSALNGAGLMLAFGLGTLPTLLGLGMLAGAAARLSEQPWLRKLAGGSVLLFGLAALWQALAPL